MTSPLVTKIAAILNQALPAAGITEAVTFVKVTPGTRTSGAVSSGTNPTTTSYSCKGFVSTEKHEKIGGTLVEKTDKVVSILGASLAATPTSNDKVTIGGVTLRVIDLQGSPALWTLLCRS